MMSLEKEQIRKLIRTIRPNKANFDYCSKNDVINGTLYLDIERIMIEHAKQSEREIRCNLEKPFTCICKDDECEKRGLVKPQTESDDCTCNKKTTQWLIKGKGWLCMECRKWKERIEKPQPESEKEKSIKTLQNAGILNEKGELDESYKPQPESCPNCKEPSGTECACLRNTGRAYN